MPRSNTILALALTLAACGGPFLVFPGGALRGDVVQEPIEDWSFVDEAFDPCGTSAAVVQARM